MNNYRHENILNIVRKGNKKQENEVQNPYNKQDMIKYLNVLLVHH